MKNELTTSNGILDIIVPVIPESDVLSSIIIIVFLICVLTAGWYLWRMFATVKGRARRRLAKLESKNTDTLENNINTAFQISGIVRDGLGLSCLSVEKTLPDTLSPEEPYWLSFVQKLDKARYSAESLSRKELQQLMSDARRWLK